MKVLFSWIACLVVVAAATASPQGPRERDVWYVLVDGDVLYGSRHVVVETLPAGGSRYTVDSRTLIDLFGSQRQEITTRGAYVVEADLRVRSINVEATTMSGSVRTEGVSNASGLSLTFTSSGTERVQTHELGGDMPLVLDVCLDDWLASLPAGTDEARVRVLDSDGWKEQMVTAVRAGPTSGSSGAVSPASWTIERGGFVQQITFGADGVVREVLIRAPSMLLRISTAAEAAVITHRVLTGRELLTFPLDKQIDAPHRLTNITVRLSWRDIPFDEFDLEDLRQRVVERSEEDGRYEAVVAIVGGASIDEPCAFPITNDRFAASLAETEYIKPSDPSIVSVAGGVVKDNANALDAVRALSSWINGYVEATMIAETLTGPEVLERKVGKCSEYSTLFASMARSVGIPARVVLGERLMGGQWMGHMWNEAYVGAWIPVDASVNEVGDTCSLLKFIHSDTVTGTQPLRWKLTESIEISVTSFETRPPELAGVFETGIDGPVYTNADYACRITASVPEWVIEDASGPGNATVRFKVPDAGNVLVHFVAFVLPPGTEAKVLTTARLNQFRANYPGFELLADEPHVVNGASDQTSGHVSGHMIRFARTGGGDSPDRFVTTEFVWTIGGYGYLMNLLAPAALHDAHLANVEATVAAFEALERPSP